MHYLIDGYNLLFRKFEVEDQLQEKRERFLKLLRSRIGSLHVSIIFDAQHTVGEATRSGYGPLDVIFTNQNETADDCILKLVKPKQTVVVTSDKHLAREARHLGAKTETAEQFLARLDKRVPKKKPVTIPKKRGELVVTRPTKKPGKSATFAECFDYFLEQFSK